MLLANSPRKPDCSSFFFIRERVIILPKPRKTNTAQLLVNRSGACVGASAYPPNGLIEQAKKLSLSTKLSQYCPLLIIFITKGKLKSIQFPNSLLNQLFFYGRLIFRCLRGLSSLFSNLLFENVKGFGELRVGHGANFIPFFL